jgi:nucleotide-binding universal stress UspA family protein
VMPHAVVEAEAAAGTESSPGLPRRLLVALDSSDHANAALREAIQWAAGTGAVLTGTHVYAAKLHDRRFRQMEGGLPERYRQEQELERQREVHDDLITRGLSIITDSYLDQAATACELRGLPFRRRSLEGKNYRELVREANSGAHDLLVMGALGLGAVAGSRIGSVCARTCRRTSIDTLVVRQPGRRLADGPIVVAVDGSDKSYGGLLTALELARRWQVPVKVVAAFDPYFHYVAFHRIAGVLSEQAGKVFRFKEQERLHEEVIDSGLAKIYDGHLAVARSIAGDQEVAVETELLAGKPHQAIEKDLVQDAAVAAGARQARHPRRRRTRHRGQRRAPPAAWANARCWLSMREYVARHRASSPTMTTSWTQEAEARMERVPSFVRNMARRGHPALRTGARALR